MYVNYCAFILWIVVCVCVCVYVCVCAALETPFTSPSKIFRKYFPVMHKL